MKEKKNKCFSVTTIFTISHSPFFSLFDLFCSPIFISTFLSSLHIIAFVCMRAHNFMCFNDDNRHRWICSKIYWMLAPLLNVSAISDWAETAAEGETWKMLRRFKCGLWVHSLLYRLSVFTFHLKIMRDSISFPFSFLCCARISTSFCIINNNEYCVGAIWWLYEVSNNRINENKSNST